MKAKTLRADALLLLTAAIWGFAFVAQRVGMEHVGPFTFNGIRFALGSLSLLPLEIARRRRAASSGRDRFRGPGAWTGGLVAGLVLFAGASFQQVGIVYTTAGKAGFITGLYVVLVPLLASFWRHRVGPGGWSGAGLAAAGLYLLSVRGGLRVDPGDALVLAGAVFWAAHVLVIAHWSRRVDPVELALRQFAVCSVLSLATAGALETTTVERVLDAGIPILYGGLLSVGIAYTLQVIAQRDAQPTVAAILMSLEAVFAALGGWIVLDETLSLRAALGCALMLAGVLASQLGRGAEPVDEIVDTRAT